MEQTRPPIFEEQAMRLMPEERILLLLDDIMLWRAGVFGWRKNVVLKGGCIKKRSGPFWLGREQQRKAMNDVEEYPRDSGATAGCEE